jgi:hypothetical protein
MLFGVLVHASEANELDLTKLAGDLAAAHQEPTSSALVALYASADILAAIADAEIALETAA